MNKILTVYDNDEPLNNVVSALTLQVDEVFYVYHHDVNLNHFVNIDKVLTRYKDIKTHFIQLSNDVPQLQQILDENKDLIIDVGGAKYLSLLLFELTKNTSYQIIYYDDEENNIKDYRTHTVITDKVFKLQIDDVLTLRGGEIKEYMHRNAADKRTIETIMEVVDKNIGNYGNFIRYITKVNSIISSSEYLGANTYQLSNDNARNLITDGGYKNTGDLFEIDEENCLTFKTRKLKELTSVSGAFLENYLFIKLNESGYFDDVKMSAVIDFSDEKYIYPVRCELDCLLIKNNRMLFVSCKSTKADADTLNEIYVHNSRFGNALSLPVLCICEELDRKYPSTYAKAEELGIYIVDRSSFVDDDVCKVFLSIVEGTYIYDDIR